MKYLFKKIHNFIFCLKYPFMKSRNVWTDKFMGYGHTLYDEIPVGWRKAFGKDFLEDLRKALIKDHDLYRFRFTQIKEKYGTLRLYNNGASENTQLVLNRYEQYSILYCVDCGQPTEYETIGWVEYLCEDCFEKRLKDNYDEERDGPFEEYSKRLKDICRLEKEQDETDEIEIIEVEEGEE